LACILPSFDAYRDGLNRYPMEFTLARKCHGQYVSEGIIPKGPVIEGASGPDQGLVIISEFISSARVMRGAIVVNPWRVEEVRLQPCCNKKTTSLSSIISHHR
jgi:trehalose-6-phosphate synthase